jgi:hypothetical protein
MWAPSRPPLSRLALSSAHSLLTYITTTTQSKQQPNKRQVTATTTMKLAAFALAAAVLAAGAAAYTQPAYPHTQVNPETRTMTNQVVLQNTFASVANLPAYLHAGNFTVNAPGLETPKRELTVRGSPSPLSRPKCLPVPPYDALLALSKQPPKTHNTTQHNQPQNQTKPKKNSRRRSAASTRSSRRRSTGARSTAPAARSRSPSGSTRSAPCTAALTSPSSPT